MMKSKHKAVVACVLLQVLFTLFIYFCLRLEFLIWNFKTFYSEEAALTVAKAFFYGLRFDLSAVSFLTFFVLLFSCFPWPRVSVKTQSLVLTLIFITVHSPFIVLNMIDTDLINFVGKRFGRDSLFLLEEVSGDFTSFLKTHGTLTLFNFLLFLSFAVGSFLIHQRLCYAGSAKEKIYGLGDFFLSLGALIIVFIAARGGLQLKPLSMAHSGVFTEGKLNQLVLNSSFTFITSFNSKPLIKPNYFQHFDDYKAYLNRAPDEQSLWPAPKRPKESPNLVLIILESFNLSYTGANQKRSYTPFLDSLMKESLSFPYAIANGKRSIESLASILAGVPSLLPEPFVSSPYQNMNIPLVGEELKKKSYETHFFHGAKTGSMFFDSFTKRIGIEHYWGLEDYPDTKDYDGLWGIWDEPFFYFTLSKMQNMKEPFFVTVFTLSSHHPFTVPEEYKDTFSPGSLPIHKSVQYTDRALENFFKKAKNQAWFQNTIFIITSDHTSINDDPDFQNPFGEFRIPLLIYSPAKNLSKLASKNDLQHFVQQIDIAPTILDLAEIATPTPRLAKSLLLKPSHRQVFFKGSGDIIWLGEYPTLLSIHQGVINSYSLSSEEPSPESLLDLEKKWKASYQYFIDGLLRGSFFDQ